MSNHKTESDTTEPVTATAPLNSNGSSNTSPQSATSPDSDGSPKPESNPLPKLLADLHHFTLGAIVFVLLAVFHLYNVWYMGDECKGQLEPLRQSTTIMDKTIQAAKDAPSLYAEQLATMRNLSAMIVNKKEYYLELAVKYYKNYYAAMVSVMVCSIFGAILLFLVAYNGWAGADALRRTIFVVVFFMGSFWGLFPSVFLQEDNYKNSFERYIDLDKLHLEMFNLVATKGKLDIAGKAVAADTVLTSFHKRLMEKGELIIGIDGSSIKDMKSLSGEIQVMGGH